MEELVILQYGSFAALGERVKYDAQQTGCSQRVTKWALWDQLYLDRLRESTWAEALPTARNGGSSHWSTCSTIQQPCSRRRERIIWRHPQAQPIETAEVMTPQHPSVRTLLGSTDREIWISQNRCTGGVCAGPQWTLPPVAGRVHDGAMTGAELVHG